MKKRKIATDHCDMCDQYFHNGDKYILFNCSDPGCGDHNYHVQCYINYYKDTEYAVTMKELEEEGAIFTWRLHRPLKNGEGAWVQLS